MAKKKEEATSLATIQAQLSRATQANRQLQSDLAVNEAMMEATYKKALEPRVTKEGKAIEKKMKTAEERMATGHIMKVDFGGGMAAQVSTELMNLGVRALADWLPETWVGQNSDYLQGGPHVLLGLGIYIAEMATRKKGQMPTTTREVVSEAAKIFGQLGFSNVVRALRVRYADGKQTQIDYAALKAEKVALEAKLRALQTAPSAPAAKK